MPTRRQDTRFQRRNVLRYLACLLLPAAAAFACPWPEMTFRVGAALVAAGVGYYLGKGLEWLALRRYRCPNCQARIGDDISNWQTSREVVFFCEPCDIEWDTGVSTPAYRTRRNPRTHENEIDLD